MIDEDAQDVMGAGRGDAMHVVQDEHERAPASRDGLTQAARHRFHVLRAARRQGGEDLAPDGLDLVQRERDRGHQRRGAVVVILDESHPNGRGSSSAHSTSTVVLP